MAQQPETTKTLPCFDPAAETAYETASFQWLKVKGREGCKLS